VTSEDGSTDGTRGIVIQYQQGFPDRFRLLLSERNLHSLAVVSRGIRACRGDFIAPLDGDDDWTDPEKLKRQVAFLETHPECSACFHNALAVPPKTASHAATGRRRASVHDSRRHLARPPHRDQVYRISDWPS
jgi:glycosyltransferase involved in cell wall biosynthesis